MDGKHVLSVQGLGGYFVTLLLFPICCFLLTSGQNGEPLELGRIWTSGVLSG
jgi:hypothetical protein